MRNACLTLLLLTIVACSSPKPPAPILIVTPTADTLIVPVVEVSVAVARTDGRWTLLAPLEDQLYIADFGAKTITPYAGISKTDLPHPVTLLRAGDSIIVGDWGLRRFTEWSPAGTRLNAWPAPDAMHGALPKARDAAGQWYFEIAPDPKADGSGLIDSAAIVRGDPQLTHFDTLARLAPPDIVQMPGITGPHYQRRTMAGSDAWGVAPDGTLWLARVYQNYIEWHHPGGKAIEKSPWLPDVTLMVSEMDRELYVRRFPEDQQDNARVLPNSPVKPPFEHAYAASGGRVWLAKSDTALAPVRHIHLVDKTGVLFNVAVPSRGFMLGADDNHILMGEFFPGGIRLLRYPVPAETKREKR